MFIWLMSAFELDMLVLDRLEQLFKNLYLTSVIWIQRTVNFSFFYVKALFFKIPLHKSLTLLFSPALNASIQKYKAVYWEPQFTFGQDEDQENMESSSYSYHIKLLGTKNVDLKYIAKNEIKKECIFTSNFVAFNLRKLLRVNWRLLNKFRYEHPPPKDIFILSTFYKDIRHLLCIIILRFWPSQEISINCSLHKLI